MARMGAKRNTRKLKIGRALGVNLWGQAKSPFNKRKYKPGHIMPKRTICAVTHQIT